MRVVPICDVCRIVSGTTPSSSEKSYWGGDVVWVTPTDLGKLKTLYITASERKISKEGRDAANLEMIPPGSVVMSSRAPIGHLAIAETHLCTNQGCKSFVPNDSLDGLYLYFLLKSRIGEIRALGSGTTFAEVSKSRLEQLFITLPDLPTQRRIAARLKAQFAEIDAARTAAEAQLDALDKLPAAYLREAFSAS